MVQPVGAPRAGGWLAAGHFRITTVPKLYFALFSCGTVFLLPFVNVFYRKCGFGEEVIGLLCALKPWVSATAGSLIVSAADASQRHLAVLLAVYCIAWLGRSLMAFYTGFAAQLVIALVTEAAASPQGSLVDAAVSASATDDGGYGRIRMWASIGWGCTAPLAGYVVGRWGLHAAFVCFTLLVGLTLLPTALLPLEVLSGRGGGGGAGPQGSAAARSSSAGGGGCDGKLESEDGGALTSLRISTGRSQGGEAGGEGGEASGHASAAAASGAAKAPPGSPAKGWSIGAHSQAAQGAPAVVRLEADCRSPRAAGAPEDGGAELPSPQRPLLGCAAIADASAGGASPAGQAPIVPAGRAGTTSPLEIAGVGSRTASKAQLAPLPAAPAGGGVAAGGGSVWAGVKELLGDMQFGAFLWLAFLMGVGNGCIGFLFLFLDELGATGTLMGLCLSFNCAAEVPVFGLSGAILERLGVQRALHVAMGAYVLRLCCYLALPLLPSTWFVLPIELLQGCTFALAWSALCLYVKRTAPPHLKSTVQSIFQGLYTGVGAGLGGLVGGLLYGRLGSAALFRTAALALAAGWVGAAAVLRVHGVKCAGQGPCSVSRVGLEQQGYRQLGVGASEEGEDAALLRP